METKIKVRFIGLDYYTLKKVSIVKTLKADEMFEDKIIPEMKINGGEYVLPLSINTAISQADEWVSKQTDYLNDLIHNPKQELKCIENWEVLSVCNKGETKPKPKRTTAIVSTKKINDSERIETLFVMLDERRETELSEDLKKDFLHAWLEMSDSLKGLSFEKKVEAVFSSMRIGYMGAVTAYKHIADFMGRSDKDSETETKQPKLSQ